ncbi:unnamed protein product [Brachionus calyciflorus]|uniref:Uncharacterized protein n=1 Tax=Brachionus calyciflorus TaxID=104777 RepID=A0A814MTQ7_9BILA|nr:unnamed protein product [Brachionus calyciflorus]
MSPYDYALCLADIERRKTTRHVVYNYFLKFSKKLVVAQEYHMDMNTVHFHIYIQYQNEIESEKLKTEIFGHFKVDMKIYFEVCLDVRSYIRYCTKDDFNVFYKNIDPKNFKKDPIPPDSEDYIYVNLMALDQDIIN